MKFDSIGFGVFATTFVAASLQAAPAKKKAAAENSGWHCMEKSDPAKSGCDTPDACATPKAVDAKDAKECANKNGEWKKKVENKAEKK